MDSTMEEMMEKLRQTREWEECEEPETTVKKVLPIYKKYSDDVAFEFFKAALMKNAREKMKDVIEGIISGGGSDKKGARFPVTYPMLLKNGKLIKVATWGGALTPPGFHKIQISGIYNERFDNYNEVTVIESSELTDLSPLIKSAKTGADRKFWEEKARQGDPVVVIGKIQYVDPIYDKDEDNQKTLPYPLLDKKNRPTMEFTFENEGNPIELRIKLQPQSRGYPYVYIKDIEEFIADAKVVNGEDKIKEQAKFLQIGIKGRNVLLMGTVMKIVEGITRNDDFVVRVYIQAASVYELSTTPTKKEEPEKPEHEQKKHTNQKKFTDGETKEEFKERINEQAKKEKPSGGVKEMVKKTVDEILEYCELVNQKPTELSLEILREINIGEQLTDAFLTVCLEKAKKEYETKCATKTGEE